MSKDPTRFPWLWHCAMPAVVGFVAGAFLGSFSGVARGELAWHMAAGGLAAGALLGPGLRAAMRWHTVPIPLGCLAAIVAPVPTLAALGLMAERGAATPVPDWVIAVACGFGGAPLPVLAWQAIVAHSRGSAGWRVGAIVGIAVAFVGLTPPMAKSYYKRGEGIASCKSNLRRLALAMQVYLQDHDGCYPPRGPFINSVGLDPNRAPDEAYGGGYLWESAEGDHQLWICPGDRGAHDRLGRRRPDYPSLVGTSYRWDVGLAGKRIDDIAAPAEAPLIFDRSPFHNDGRNVAFVDGHVKWIPESRFATWDVEAR